MEHLKMMISGFYTTVSGQTLRQTDKSDNYEERQTLTSFKWEENIYHLQNICFIVYSHLCSQLCVDCITCWRESQCDVESQCESPSLMSALLACLVTTGTVHWTLSLPLGQAHTGGLGHYGFNVHFENEYIEESKISNEGYCTL